MNDDQALREATRQDILRDPIGEYIDRMLRQVPGLVPEPLADQLEANARELLVTKRSAIIEVPKELLMDAGVIPDTREHKPVPWRWRVKWKLRDVRTWLAEIAYRVIAGDWPPSDDED